MMTKVVCFTGVYFKMLFTLAYVGNTIHQISELPHADLIHTRKIVNFHIQGNTPLVKSAHGCNLGFTNRAIYCSESQE